MDLRSSYPADQFQRRNAIVHKFSEQNHEIIYNADDYQIMLKITDLTAFTLGANFEWTFVRVYSGDSYGTGEAGPAPGLSAMAPGFKRLLLGEDAFKINRLDQKMRFATLYSGTTTYHFISAVNMAIYDLIGKTLNLPIYRLLGGDRQQIRVYVDSHAGKGLEAMDSLLLPQQFDWMDLSEMEKDRLTSANNPIHGRLSQEKWNDDYAPESYVERAKRMIGEGFTAMKFDLDIPTPYTKDFNTRSGDLSMREVDYLASIVRAIRESSGEEIDLMVDLHWRYSVNSALRLCKALEPYRLRWVEDPIPAQMTIGNLDVYKELTSKTTVPIETGENMYTVYQFKDLIGTGIRVWSPDLAKTGGILEGRRISELASLYEVEYSPHNIGSPIATMAQAQAASVSNTFGVLEFHGHDVPFWNKMVKGGKTMIKDGFIELSDAPGLGVEMDDGVIRKYWPDFHL